MIPRFIARLILVLIAVPAHAWAVDVSAFVSCVGAEYVALVPEHGPADKADGQEFCVAGGGLTVCRKPLADAVGNDNTMAVTVRARGEIVQEWFENGDPGYLTNVFAFRGVGNRHDAVVATQQSESQGMGVQEWLVNVVALGGHPRGERHTFSTADFGPLGALVKKKGQVDAACHVLTTRWETRHTARGDRLFLTGKLLALPIDSSAGSGDFVLSRRFDQRLARLREMQPDGRPLAYFKR